MLSPNAHQLAVSMCDAPDRISTLLAMSHTKPDQIREIASHALESHDKDVGAQMQKSAVAHGVAAGSIGRRLPDESPGDAASSQESATAPGYTRHRLTKTIHEALQGAWRSHAMAGTTIERDLRHACNAPTPNLERILALQDQLSEHYVEKRELISQTRGVIGALDQ